MLVEEAPCPQCGAAPGALSVTPEIVAAPLGTWSLAGMQMKTTTRIRPVLCCSACDLRVPGELDEDGRHVTFPAQAPN